MGWNDVIAVTVCDLEDLLVLVLLGEIIFFGGIIGFEKTI